MSEPMKWQNHSIYVQTTDARVQDLLSWEKDGDTWICPVLQRHFEKYGEVTDAWIPWKTNDGRDFARVWFKDYEAAAQAVKASPHLIGKSEFIVDFQRPSPMTPLVENHHGKQGGQAPGRKGGKDDGEPSVDEFLRQVPEEEYRELSWDKYLAPKSLKETLQRIGEDHDSEKQKRRRLSRQKLFGNPNIEAPGIPIVLFHGPAGTGKTFGMTMLAVQSGMKPWILQMAGLQERSRKPVALFHEILQRIETLEKAIIFIDECETCFPNREVMASYASIDVRAHQKMIGAFLEWAQGLATISYSDGKQPPLLCLATNIINAVDPAIRDRSRTIVSFDLPSPAQCTEWWSLHARHLNGSGRTQRFQFPILGLLSWVVGLSFRRMWSIAEKMVDRDANVGETMFSEYVAEILAHGRQELPSALDVVKSSYRWTWALHNVVWLLDHLRQTASRSRARL
mmetsp:Transcript_103562/g.221489  ORF Transcript_103562/g.221489 Transcript_103562/m.221489 type:complete len:453 (-) Transcript_103562:35-1393(-)